MRWRMLLIAGVASLTGCASNSAMHVVFQDGTELYCQPHPGADIEECDSPDSDRASDNAEVLVKSLPTGANAQNPKDPEGAKEPWVFWFRAVRGPQPVDQTALGDGLPHP